MCIKVVMSVAHVEVLTVEDGCWEERIKQKGRKKKTQETMWAWCKRRENVCRLRSEKLGTTNMHDISWFTEKWMPNWMSRLNSLFPLFFSFSCFNFKKCYVFILFEVGGGRGRGQKERERENLKQAACPTQSLTWDSIPWPWDHDLSQNRVGCSTDWATQEPQCFISTR